LKIFITFRAFGLLTLLIALFIYFTYSNVKCFPADRQVSKVADTSNLSSHFRYRKLKFCVYFDIEIGNGSADTDLKSIGIGIELKILVSPITMIKIVLSQNCKTI
jgi:hypothetical protein